VESIHLSMLHAAENV